MANSSQTDLPGAGLELALRSRATPLLRISSFSPSPDPADVAHVVAKLESLRPSGSAADRALAVWDAVSLPPAGELLARLSSGSVLAATGWARARGRSLRAIVHGPLTHEVLETLALWGATVERAASRAEANSVAGAHAAAGAQLLPSLDGAEAIAAAQETLGTELVRALDEAALSPSLLIAPAGSVAALLGAAGALRSRWPGLRVFALCAASASDVLPALPEPAEAEALFAELAPDLGVELLFVTRAEALSARTQLARSHGLSASHASAAAIAKAGRLATTAPGSPGRAALALVTATGEREFSLDPAPPASAPFDAAS